MAAEDFEVLDADPLRRVELAMHDLREGKMVIVVDDEDRENEGDIVIAAEKVTPELINFMAVHARGLICLSLTGDQVDKLGLPMMATNNKSAYETAFTVSIEAREGVTTGISAADRAHTIQVAIRPDARPHDIVVPGHVFPLRARRGGVLERVGQTEGSVDLARLAGLMPAAVICEIMNPDGAMARMPELEVFGREHGIRICAVADIIKYRMRHERIVRPVGDGTMQVDGLGTWRTRLYRGMTTDGLHLALTYGDLDRAPTLVRVQASPPPWTFLCPDSVGMAADVRRAMAQIHAAGSGAIVLMHQGGLSNDVLERRFVKDFGLEEPAGIPLARADALRDLGAGCQILRDIGLQQLRILTNGKRPILGIEAYGLDLVERVPLSS
jgi:3,4-dihydroxy 2-butanone 4-phosphate synthase/GTP cyclohydrolase II